MALMPFHRSNLGSGVLDRGDAIGLPDGYMSTLFNFYPDQSSFYTRSGYQPRYTGFAKPWGDEPIQAIHFWVDNTQTKRIIIAANGNLYRDDMDGNAPTSITGTLSFSTDKDARFHFVNWDGKIYGTDGENSLFVIESGSANAVLLGKEKDVPGRASAVGSHRNHIFWGNFTDTDRDRTNRPYGTIHSDIGKPKNYPAQIGVRNDYNRSQTVVALRECNNSLYIFQDGSVHVAQFAPSTSLGHAVTNFNYDQLHGEVGLAAGKAIATTKRGLFFLGENGVYWVAQNTVPERPVYVGKPCEEFWSQVNKARLPYAVGGEIREKNLVVFCVPHGSGQATNNKAIVFNYDSWHQFSSEVESAHPAFAIWDGAVGQPFTFNALGKIVDTDGRHRLLGGDLEGNVFVLDEGTNDNGTDFRPRFEFPLIGDPRRETTWQSFILDCNLPQRQLLQATQVNYEYPASHYQTIDAGTVGAALDAFVLDVDVLGGDTLGPIEGVLYGESRYTKLGFELLSGTPMGVHQLTVYGEPGDIWV